MFSDDKRNRVRNETLWEEMSVILSVARNYEM
jgi:hypothetical protein